MARSASQIAQASEIATAYKRYADTIRAFIFAKMGCFQTAEDLTQETYIRLFKSDDMGGIQDVRSYLFRIAQNLVIDHYRSQNNKSSPREIRDIAEEHDLADTAPTAEEIVSQREQIKRGLSAVAELSHQCQRIFWLSRVEGYRNHEIAHMQNVCLSTVEKNLSRASKQCLQLAS